VVLIGARLAIMPPGPLALDMLADAVVRQGVTTLWLPETQRICHETACGNHARVTRLPNGRYSIDGKRWLADLADDAGRRKPFSCAKTFRRVRPDAGPLKLKTVRNQALQKKLDKKYYSTY
jgi:hypothetical protein